MNTRDVVVLAADGLSLEQCIALTKKIGSRLYAVKIHSVFDEYGARAINDLREAGASRIFLDAKLHDIPKTAGLRAKAIAKHGVDILTVHASGGVEMMQAAMQSGIKEVLGISILTSLSPERVATIYGKERTLEQIVRDLALNAKKASLTGVVSSPKEVSMLSSTQELQGMRFVTPGIRSAGKDSGDQKRVDTPKQALASGSSLLVIGRQLTETEDPVTALDQVEFELN